MPDETEDHLLNVLTLLLSILSKYGEDEAWRIIANICDKVFSPHAYFELEDLELGHERETAVAVVQLLLDRKVIGKG